MKLGINLWTVYGWNPPETVSPEVIRALAQLGSRAVELVIDDAHNTAENVLGRRQELRDVLQACELEVPGVGSTLFWRYNLAAQDAAVRQRGLAVVADGCRVAQAFGARVVLVVAGQQEPHVDYARSYETAVQTLRKAAALAADLGLVIGVENVRTNFLCSPGEYARFIADVDHPAVQAYLDVGNGMSMGPSYPENWITALHGHIALVHVKDYDRALNAYVCCGEGDLPWADTITALRAAGYDDYLLVETPPRAGRGTPERAVGLHAAQTSLHWLARYV